MVKISLFRQSHRRVPHRTSAKTPYCRQFHPGRSLQKSLSCRSCRGAWAHNLWEEWILSEDKTPQLAETQGMIALALSTRKKFRTSGSGMGRAMSRRDTWESQNEETKSTRSTTHHRWHEWVMRECRHLSRLGTVSSKLWKKKLIQKHFHPKTLSSQTIFIQLTNPKNPKPWKPSKPSEPSKPCKPLEPPSWTPEHLNARLSTLNRPSGEALPAFGRRRLHTNTDYVDCTTCDFLVDETVIGWKCHWMKMSLDEKFIRWSCCWMKVSWLKVSLDESVEIGWKCFGWKCHWMKSCLDESAFHHLSHVVWFTWSDARNVHENVSCEH